MELPPDDCLDCFKGLRNKEPFLGGGFDYTVFSDAKPLEDGWKGSSVNWDLQGGEALEQLLRQTKDDQIQFKAGVIRIPRQEIDKVIGRFGDDKLCYELRKERGNVYHGHILFAESLEKRQETTIKALLANAYTEYYPQEGQHA